MYTHARPDALTHSSHTHTTHTHTHKQESSFFEPCWDFILELSPKHQNILLAHLLHFYRTELRDGLSQWGVDVSDPSLVLTMMLEADIDGNNGIDFCEFKDVMFRVFENELSWIGMRHSAHFLQYLKASHTRSCPNLTKSRRHRRHFVCGRTVVTGESVDVLEAIGTSVLRLRQKQLRQK